MLAEIPAGAEKEHVLQFDGTQFSILLGKPSKDGFFVNTILRLQNEHLHYEDKGESVSLQELDDWITCMHRLLAGAYNREYTLTFERAGLVVELYPHTQDGKEVSREERRKNDCIMAVRMLLRSADKKQFLGGVHTYLAHKKEIRAFANSLREEFDKLYGELVQGAGEYRFVGVSPLGYRGCGYWYLDEGNCVEKGEYVWVRMGRHNTEQIVTVDRVRFCSENDAPYPIESVRRILRKAKKEELNETIKE